VETSSTREPAAPPDVADEPARQPRARDWRRRLSLLLSAAALALLLSTVLAWTLGGRWWVAELLANLPVQHALAFAVLLVAVAALRHRWLLALSVAGLVANLAIITPILLTLQRGEPLPPIEGASTLHVTFFNTKYFADRVATIEHLRERDDDVVVLALAMQPWREDLEAADLGLHIRAGPGPTDGEDLELVALVRDPGAEVTVHRPTSDPRDAIVEVVVDLDSQPIHVLATHAVSPLTADRAAQRDRILARLAVRAKEHGSPVVVVGDLNATPWSPKLQEMLLEAELIDSQVGFGLQPSFPAARGRLGLAIDHVLHSTDLTTVARQLGPSFGSDHRMVHAQLAPAAPGSAEPVRDAG
jgi:endonuclease/exonuclease/phosphatase (EEP) superfamily protein YafD